MTLPIPINYTCCIHGTDYGIALQTTHASNTFAKNLDVAGYLNPLPFDMVTEYGLYKTVPVGEVRRVNNEEFNSLSLEIQERLKAFHSKHY